MTARGRAGVRSGQVSGGAGRVVAGQVRSGQVRSVTGRVRSDQVSDGGQVSSVVGHRAGQVRPGQSLVWSLILPCQDNVGPNEQRRYLITYDTEVLLAVVWITDIYSEIKTRFAMGLPLFSIPLCFCLFINK